MINQSSVDHVPKPDDVAQPGIFSSPSTEKSWKKKLRRAAMLAVVLKRWKKKDKPKKFTWRAVPTSSNFSKTLGRLDTGVEDHWFPVPYDDLYPVLLI